MRKGGGHGLYIRAGWRGYTGRMAWVYRQDGVDIRAGWRGYKGRVAWV